MFAKKIDEKTKIPKLYKCQKCGKKVILDDYNLYFQICITCEHKSGTTWEKK